LVFSKSVIALNICIAVLASEGHWLISENKEYLMFGRGKAANVELHFTDKQHYNGALGMLPEQHDKIRLQISNPQKLMNTLLINHEMKLAN